MSTTFTEQEWAAVGETVKFKGTKRAAFRKGACKFGTPGYIFQQARTLALNPYRMPSEFVLLLTAEQKDLLLSLSDKLSAIAKDPAARKAFDAELHRRFLA
jgi:hypothetical protein